MNNRSATERLSSTIMLSLLALVHLLALTACGVLEVGIEPGSPTEPVKVAGVDTAVPTPTAGTRETRRVPRMMTPTPTPGPRGALSVAFTREGDVWLSSGWGEPVPLTQTGDVGENSVRISDDGAIVSFTRGMELWAIDTDGTAERRLASEADFDAMQPVDPGVWLHRYDWVPGTHTLAFNTSLRKEFALDPTDDLHLVDADTGEQTVLLPPGQGGHFYYSPKGSQIAIVRSGTIDLVDAGGGNRRPGVLTYTPSVPRFEVRYYAEVVWAADSSALGVTVLPPDPYAQPAQYTTVWHVPADGRPGRLVANIPSAPDGRIAFSPDLAYAAHLQQPESAATLGSANLMITELGAGKTTLYATGVWRFAAWAPEARQFAFMSIVQPDVEKIEMQVGWLDRRPVPVESPAGVLALDARWIDASRYLVLSKSANNGNWLLILGDGGGPEKILASIPELPGSDVPSYDFASQQTPVVAAPTPTPEPILRPPTRLGVLHVAYVKDGDVWLWKDGPALSSAERKEVSRVTDGGSVTDVRISGDGETLVFAREGELWAVDGDGTNERMLVSKADLSAIEPQEQTAFPTVLNRFDWVPGTHTVAYNTRLDSPIGLMLNDDLRLVDVDTMEQSLLLSPGQGGEFTYSPGGRQVAVANGGGISLIDADGGNRRDVLTYTPVATGGEHLYYARPAWAADSQSLRVAIPPVDPLAQPPQPTGIWHLPTDGTSATLTGNVTVRPGSWPAFSPELRYLAYLEQSVGAVPGDPQGKLLVLDLETGDTLGEYRQAYNVYGWSPDSERFAFLADPSSPRAQIGQLGGLAVPAYDDAGATTIDVRWVDAKRYLFLASTSGGWSLLLGQVDGPATVLASVAGRSLPYDFAY